MKKMKVAMIETGIARTGIIVERQSCKKINTTSTTSASASRSVIINFAD
jgi:hypothetical protein